VEFRERIGKLNKAIVGLLVVYCRPVASSAMASFGSQKILQIFLNSPLHQIFRHMHEALNIDKK
jgi:branched-subunit amino acid transport protein AzlD